MDKNVKSLGKDKHFFKPHMSTMQKHWDISQIDLRNCRTGLQVFFFLAVVWSCDHDPTILGKHLQKKEN